MAEWLLDMFTTLGSIREANRRFPQTEDMTNPINNSGKPDRHIEGVL